MKRLAGTIFLSILCISLESKPLEIDVSAPSAILMNADNGKILYEKDAHTRRAPGSTTKIATAVYLLEKKGNNLEEITVASQDCIGVVTLNVKRRDSHPSYRLENDGTSAGIRVGEKNSLKTLLYGLMLVSGNDAGNVIAEHVSGSVEQYMKELNQFMRGIGMKNTNFTNPHGLHCPNHLTTAYDMALLARAGLKSSTFREVVGSARFSYPESNKRPAGQFVQLNRLIRPGKFFYPKAIGIKTGYHSKAGFCLVAAAEHEGRTLIAVILNAPSSEMRFKDAIALFEKAFAEKKVQRKLFTKEYDTFSKEIEGAESVLQASLAEDLYLEYYPSEESEYKAIIDWKAFTLPVEIGQSVATLKILDEKGEILKKVSLHAKSPVKAQISYMVKKNCGNFWQKYLVFIVSFLFIGGISGYIWRIISRSKRG